MRTKNFFLIAALIICGLVCVNSVKAQAGEGNIKLKLVLNPVQSIVVNNGNDGADVKLEYKNLTDYLSGSGTTSVEVQNQLTVFSTGKFTVNAKATTFTATDGTTEAIPGIGTIQLQARSSGGAYSGDYITLATGEELLYSNSKGTTATSGLGIDVTYSGATANAYLNEEYFKKTAEGVSQVTTFESTITYSLYVN